MFLEWATGHIYIQLTSSPFQKHFPHPLPNVAGVNMQINFTHTFCKPPCDWLINRGW